MVSGFEDQTHELSDYELNTLVPRMVAGFRSRIGSKKAITSTKAIKQIKESGLKVDPARFRKVVNYIRTNGLISNLVATGKGYHIAENELESRRFLESLKQRIQSITLVHDAMEFQLRETLKNKK
jgi:hypothetical protein